MARRCKAERVCRSANGRFKKSGQSRRAKRAKRHRAKGRHGKR